MTLKHHNLVELVRATGLTQRAFCALAGCSHSLWRAMLHGARTPEKAVARSIASALNAALRAAGDNRRVRLRDIPHRTVSVVEPRIVQPTPTP